MAKTKAVVEPKTRSSLYKKNLEKFNIKNEPAEANQKREA